MSHSIDEDVQQIVEAYTHTRLTVAKFELLVREILTNAELRGAEKGGTGKTYDQGFTDGWDACLVEEGLAE